MGMVASTGHTGNLQHGGLPPLDTQETHSMEGGGLPPLDTQETHSMEGCLHWTHRKLTAWRVASTGHTGNSQHGGRRVASTGHTGNSQYGGGGLPPLDTQET